MPNRFPLSDRCRLPEWSTAGGLLALVLWSSTFALARSVAEQVGPLTAATAVYLTGGGFGLLRWQTRGRPWERFRRLPARYFWGCGGLFALYTLLIYLAVGMARDRAQLVEVALVNYLWPAGTLLLSIPLLRYRAGFWLLPGTALALAGVFLVMTQGTSLSGPAFLARGLSQPGAYLLALLAALAWALYSNLARLWGSQTREGGVELFLLLTGLVLLLSRTLAQEVSIWTPRAVVEVLGLGGITALAYGLWDLAMRQGNLLLVAACSYFTPLMSTLVSCLYLGVQPGPQLWAGTLLLIAGSWLSRRGVEPPREAAASPNGDGTCADSPQAPGPK